MIAQDESLSSHHLVPFQEFIKAPRTIHSRSWKAQPWWFLSWGLRQLGVIDSSTAAGSLPTGQFVVVANVEQAVSKVFEQMAAWTSQVDRIHPMEMFREEAGSAMGLDGRISDSDLAILLAVLSRDKGAIVHDSEAVKFRVPGDQSTTLSAEDRTIASLKLLITNLSGQVSHLLKRIRVLTATAREAVGRKDRISALTALKSRKLTENTLAQRTDTLSQVEGVLHQIEQAHDQVTMIKVMKDSTSVLHNLRTQTGGVEEVEQIVEDLRDEMQQVDEIGNAIEASEESNAVDDDTVNAELEQIMQQAQTLKEENEAHGTQQRLAEIENTMANMPQPTKTGQVSVDDGIVALKGLSLNEESARPDQFESASNG